MFNMQRERTVLHLNVERRDESLSQGLLSSLSRNCGASSKAPVRHIHAVSLVNVFVNVIFLRKSLVAICQREALRSASLLRFSLVRDNRVNLLDAFSDFLIILIAIYIIMRQYFSKRLIHSRRPCIV